MDVQWRFPMDFQWHCPTGVHSSVVFSKDCRLSSGFVLELSNGFSVALSNGISLLRSPVCSLSPRETGRAPRLRRLLDNLTVLRNEPNPKTFKVQNCTQEAGVYDSSYSNILTITALLTVLWKPLTVAAFLTTFCLLLFLLIVILSNVMV